MRTTKHTLCVRRKIIGVKVNKQKRMWQCSAKHTNARTRLGSCLEVTYVQEVGTRLQQAVRRVRKINYSDSNFFLHTKMKIFSEVIGNKVGA